MKSQARTGTAVSQYAIAEAQQLEALPRSVTISDTTLRDGEQTAGVSFAFDDRVAIVRALSSAGVGQIQLSYPGISREDAESTRRLVNLRLPSTTEVIAMLHVANWKHQIEAAIDTGADVVSVIHGVAAVRLRDVYKMSGDEAIAQICRGVEYAKSRGASVVNVSPTDTPRADEALLRDLYPAVVAAGADRVRINDSAGASSPAGMRRIVTLVKSLVDVPIGVHCHDDFGLAAANTIAAVEAGASIVDVCVNGLGERAGNAALEEIVTTLELLYDVSTGVDLARLTQLSELVATASRRAVPGHKSIVGRDVFSHTFDTHVRDFASGGWALHEPFKAELVGNERRFPLHRMSGVHAIRLWLEMCGLEADDGQVSRLVPAVREAAAAIETSLTADDFRSIAKEVLKH